MEDFHTAGGWLLFELLVLTAQPCKPNEEGKIGNYSFRAEDIDSVELQVPSRLEMRLYVPN